MRISIKAKLAGGFGVLLVLTGLAGGVGYQRLVAADAAMRFVVERAEVQNHVLSAKALAIRDVSTTRATVISTTDEQMAEHARRASDYRAASARMAAPARPGKAATKAAVPKKTGARTAAPGFALDMGEGDARDAEVIRAA
jgi:methyl-accepting chemotaxis protein